MKAWPFVIQTYLHTVTGIVKDHNNHHYNHLHHKHQYPSCFEFPFPRTTVSSAATISWPKSRPLYVKTSQPMNASPSCSKASEEWANLKRCSNTATPTAKSTSTSFG